MSAPLPDALPGEVDVVVVGAGGAGMTRRPRGRAAGPGHRPASRRARYFGGSTARSGGGVWIPGNYALKAAGQVAATTSAQAKLYLDSIVGDDVPKVRRDTYLDRGPEVMDFIQAHTPVRFRGSRSTPTTTPRRPAAAPRAAACEPVPLDAAVPRRRARPAAPGVHQGAGQPDRHAGRLPQDQPRPAHPPRPG